MKVLILGGTRFVGRHVAAQLLDRGAEVTLLHRGVTGEGIAGAASVVGDRSEPTGWRRSATSASTRSSTCRRTSQSGRARLRDPAWTRVALRVHLERSGVPSVGGAPVARGDAVWTDPDLGSVRPREGRLGADPLGCPGRRRIRRHAFRFPFILGPGNFADRESFVFGRLAAGRPILLPAGGSALNQFVYAEDVARAIVATLERPDIAGGQAYNCTYAKPITNRGWVAMCADVLGVEAELVAIDEAELGVASPTVDLGNIVFPYPPSTTRSMVPSSRASWASR